MNRIINEQELANIVKDTPLATLVKLLKERGDVVDISIFTATDADEMAGYYNEDPKLAKVG